ncbi:MAG: hypothetical protein IPL33_20565 [Sphingobacteriales bacterium]|nr:hypothetical protein [Sphingobacteriales bacterium]
MKIPTSLCYFALNLMRSNFTCYGELRRFVRLIGKSSHNRRQRPHSRRMPSRVRFCPNFAPRPSMRVMDGCVLLAVVFAFLLLQ